MSDRCVSKQTLQRLPSYLSFLRSLGPENGKFISATGIAEALGLNDVVVRKDLASVSSLGRPKVGYNRAELTKELERFLGYDNSQDAILVGAGRLGQALLGYGGFPQYGLNILAGFDRDPKVCGQQVAGKRIFPVDKLPDFCRRLGVHIGIVTVPGEYAQEVCDQLIDSGILAVWNFANAHLTVPEGILVQNENMAVSLALLSNHLKEVFSTK